MQPCRAPRFDVNRLLLLLLLAEYQVSFTSREFMLDLDLNPFEVYVLRKVKQWHKLSNPTILINVTHNACMEPSIAIDNSFLFNKKVLK